MKTFTRTELEVRLMTDCGIRREFSDPCGFEDALYLCPSKTWLLKNFPNLVQEFLNKLDFMFRENSSDCDDAVDIALVRGSHIKTAKMFGRRCSAETLGDKLAASYAMGEFVYRDATRSQNGNSKHAVLFAVTYDEASDLCEAHFLECVPPVQWINLTKGEKESCCGYYL
jgi:hypothetical protein